MWIAIFFAIDNSHVVERISHLKDKIQFLQEEAKCRVLYQGTWYDGLEIARGRRDRCQQAIDNYLRQLKEDDQGKRRFLAAAAPPVTETPIYRDGHRRPLFKSTMTLAEPSMLDATTTAALGQSLHQELLENSFLHLTTTVTLRELKNAWSAVASIQNARPQHHLSSPGTFDQFKDQLPASCNSTFQQESPCPEQDKGSPTWSDVVAIAGARGKRRIAPWCTTIPSSLLNSFRSRPHAAPQSG